MIPVIVSFVGLTLSALLAMFIYRVGRAYLRKRMREAATRDAKRYNKEDTIG